MVKTPAAIERKAKKEANVTYVVCLEPLSLSQCDCLVGNYQFFPKWIWNQKTFRKIILKRVNEKWVLESVNHGKRCQIQIRFFIILVFELCCIN